MLDTDTKRRIDTARDILVGKVPDPKSQVEQITIALIYKFMDDMDAESEEFGGKRKFFAGEFARYGWAKLMRSGLGGHETLNLYAEAIAKMPENPGIPLLFRDIFKNAYLPYRDPETLRAFLKVIDEFEYDHSERLGDAFEYLLSVLGSQGEAGQFRTPRHIIDFMVEIIDPKKTETVLDPACGTAGFLISSYKHILKVNTDAKGNSTLTPDEKGRLAQNFKGYDISPDMVRLSLVNLYLHGFADPHIYEYDTLTSQEHWNEYADVILANPPFMSPKGGIKPHNRFSVQSKRSEVLFVDYMAEHLTPNGRAGIIVPEGIIFQSQTAYKQLRKLLVEEYLVAVVSLPAGVFNPYSGVKTSILILDKSLAKKTNTIAFFKVENDGFGLGAQRREIDKNDLPQTHAEIGEYLRRLRAGESVEDFQPTLGLIVEKEKIAANGEYNLSGERYRENGARKTAYEWTELGAITLGSPQYGSGASKVPFDSKVRYVRITDLTDRGELKSEDPVSPSIIEQDCFLETGDLLIARSGSVGRTYLHRDLHGTYQYAGYLIRFRIDPAKALSEFVFHVTQSDPWREWILSNSKTGTLTNINAKQYSSFRFPLPPLEVQKEIVAEIEGYQKVINGARAVLDHYCPHIPIHPDWPMVELGEVCFFKRGPFGGSLKKEIFVKNGYAVYEQSHAITNDFSEFRYFVDEDKFTEMHGFQVRPGELIMSCSGTMGKVAIIPDNAPAGIINQALLKLTPKDCVLGVFLKLWMESTNFQESLADFTYGAAIKNVASVEILKGLRLPLPPLATQQAIVAEIEAEQALVAANRELIARFEKKIRATLARIWGEDEPATAEV
ncbi:MAG: N-6 DNA methylase [Candidatus Eisenbacteria bacterium]